MVTILLMDQILNHVFSLMVFLGIRFTFLSLNLNGASFTFSLISFLVFFLESGSVLIFFSSHLIKKQIIIKIHGGYYARK